MFFPFLFQLRRGLGGKLLWWAEQGKNERYLRVTLRFLETPAGGKCMKDLCYKLQGAAGGRRVDCNGFSVMFGCAHEHCKVQPSAFK